MNQLLSKPIKIADQVIRSASGATSYKKECCKIMSKTQKLTAMFQKILTLADSKFYDRPIYRVIESTQDILEDTLSLVLRCSAKGLKKYLYDLSIIAPVDFDKSLTQLENSIQDVDWLLDVCFSNSRGIDKCTYWPPFASNETANCVIWKQIAILYTGPSDDKSDAVAALLLIAKDSELCGRLIIEEGGAESLLELVEEGKMECRENAAKAIGYLGHDQETVEYLIRMGVCNVFAVILKEGPMKVQAAVAWAVSQLAANYPKCQDTFLEHNIVTSLIKHFSFEIVQERYQNEFVVNKATSVLAIVMARNRLNTSKAIEELEDSKKNVTLSTADPETKDYMKAMVAKALCDLVRGNIKICRYITESRALACFVFLLEKGAEDVRHYSAMALMEITALVEQDSDLRRSTFRSSSPSRKIVVDQLVKVIEAGEDSVILIPCIKAIGNLARTFRAIDTRMIASLVRLLNDEREGDVSGEAVVALSKLSCTENYLHLEHSKAIIEAGGAKHLVQLVYFSEQAVQPQALLLLCYIVVHVPTSEELVQAEVPLVLEWASKQSFLIQDQTLDSLLPKAKSMVSKTAIPLYSLSSLITDSCRNFSENASVYLLN